MAGTRRAVPCARDRDRSRLEIADQPRACARGAGGRAGLGSASHLDHRRSAAQPRYRPDDRRAARPRPARRRGWDRADRQRPNRARRGRPGGLRPGRHGFALCSAAGGPGRCGSGVRRRRAGPAPAHRTTAGCTARSRRSDRRHRPAVPGHRQRIGRRRQHRHRCIGVIAVRVRPAAVRGVLHRGPDRATHRFDAAVGAAHRDDGGDAAAGRRRRRRLRRQPLAGAARCGRGPALGRRTRSHERGRVPRGRRGHRRHRAHHRLARDQRATRRRHPERLEQAQHRCHAC